MKTYIHSREYLYCIDIGIDSRYTSSQEGQRLEIDSFHIASSYSLRVSMADPNITSQGAEAVVVFDLLVVIVKKKKPRDPAVPR